MAVWHTAGYLRLSREDGDKAESDSITNQRKLLERYLEGHPELELVGFYQDDGCTGTHFDRPAFRRMEADIHAGRVNCVLVKDLSRFGRDYIEMGRYLEREFPARGVRFIAVNDHVDSQQGKYDLLLPMKNLFNTQYARDISEKVRSAIRTKQQRGEFVGAFASYGYRKDPADHNRLLIDPPAAQVVQRIFALFEAGSGKLAIARQLNREGLPSPSEYKRLAGQHYHNGRKLEKTGYWTYATIHRILKNGMYAGDMEQGRARRPAMHGRVQQQAREAWTVVPDTHEAIIPREQWERVQDLLHRRARQVSFARETNPFAGFLRCGDCGRAMVRDGRAGYCCGSYKRYGPEVCSRHGISQAELEEIVGADLERVLAAAGDLADLADETAPACTCSGGRAELEAGVERLFRRKKAAYEDYRDGLLRRQDYLRYQEDYERQERELAAQLAQLSRSGEAPAGGSLWAEQLLRTGRLPGLDRLTVAETVRQIRVFADGGLEITYAFADPGTSPAEPQRSQPEDMSFSGIGEEGM